MCEDEHAAQRTETGDAVDPLLKAIGRQIKFLRERAGLTQAELGERIGYGVDLVSSVERGRRAPKPQFIDGAERVLDAGGVLKAVQDDVERARYPARFREFAMLEADAVEIHTYSNHVIPGLLQTRGYARAIYAMRRPTLSEEEIEQQVEARLARHSTLTREPPPVLSFVIEEVVLRRPLGGASVLHEQMRHLVQVGRLRHVEIQVMPTSCEEHAGLVGPMTLLEPADQPRVAYTEGQGRSTWFTEHADVRTIDARYGIIRAQALTPRETREFIEQLLGET